MYNIKLLNVPFDNHYNNSPYFPKLESREQYFNGIVGEQPDKKVNFNKNNLLYTDIIINKLDDINKYNYVIVTNENDVKEVYHYFILSCNYISVNQYRLNLELDVITQYFINIDETSFSKCNILRGMVNRFSESYTDEHGNKFYDFNINLGSKILLDEDNTPTITNLTGRQALKVQYDNTENRVFSQGEVNVNKWLQANILCWCYVFLDYNQNYKYNSLIGKPYPTTSKFLLHQFRVGDTIGDTIIDNEYTCICVPIYKNNKSMIRFLAPFGIDLQQKFYPEYIYLGVEALREFRNDNNNLNYIYNIKFSKIPPFQLYVTDGWELVEEDNTTFLQWTKLPTNGKIDLIDCSCRAFGDASVTEESPNYHYDLWGGFTDIHDKVTSQTFLNFETVVTNDKYTFTPNEIKGVPPSMSLEPKMLNLKKYTLSDNMGNNLDISPLLWNSKYYRCIYREPLNVTTTNYYFAFNPQGLYSTDLLNSEWGVSGNADNSQQVANDNYSTFLTNNKIYFLSNIAQALGNIAMQNYVGLGMQAVNIATNKYNLQSQPNSVQSLNDNIMLNLQKNEGINLYINTTEVTEVEKEKYFQNIFMNGYNINMYDNINNYINTRVFFNYIQAEVENVNLNLPHNVEEKLKQILLDGIRLWNSHDKEYFLNYEYENYEIKIKKENPEDTEEG